MNRLYAILIMLYCWHKSLSQKSVGLQEYHAPGSQSHLEPLKQNQSAARFTLSYQQILRKLLLPYRHQPPYCYHIPSVHYHNTSIQQDLSNEPRYLLFYYNSLYHQNLLSYNHRYSQDQTNEEKPPSGYLLFYYNTFYHQNSEISQTNMHSVYDTVQYFSNGTQQDMSQWATTPYRQHQEGWTYGKMVALTSSYISDYKRIISPGTQKIILDSLDTYNHPNTRKEKTLTCSLLKRLVRILNHGPRSEQNQTDNDEWLSIVTILKNTFPEIRGLSSYHIVNVLMAPKVRSFIRNITKEQENLYNNVTEEWKEFMSYKPSTNSRNEFISGRNLIQHENTKDFLRTFYCRYIFNIMNKTDNGISDASFGQISSNLSEYNQTKRSENDKCFEKVDNKLNLQNKHGCNNNPMEEIQKYKCAGNFLVMESHN